MEQKAKEYFDANRERIFSELFAFLSWKSVSTDPAFDADCMRCVEWLREHVEQIGLQAEIIPTEGKPLLFASRASDPQKPTMLFYGHYDVQPVDPIDLWKRSPFDPKIEDGKIWARGAQDNKGQLFYVLKAIEYLIQADTLGWNVKLLIEGEEECGSGGITLLMESLREKVAADVLLVCDTGTRDKDVCSVTMGLRGIIGFGLRLFGLRTDLHSGVHGGVAPNPATSMVHLLSKLHDASGKIAVPGFYDGVVDATREELDLALRTPITDDVYRAMSGVLPTGGERDLPFCVRRGFRPTVEINGIHAGYGGRGMKTIIPSEAIAKVSARLVTGQDPDQCLQALLDFIESHAPAGLHFEILDPEVGGPALRLDSTSPVVTRAAQILEGLSPHPVEFMWEGASIPVLSLLAEASNATPLLVGFGLEEDNIHAPNESFRVQQFEKGFAFSAALLTKGI